MKVFKGQFDGKGIRIGIVVGKFNELITQSLLTGALDGLARFGVAEENIAVAWVPGAFEIALITKQMALSNQYDALICLGAVIKGATPHFDFVAGQAASGIAQIGLEFNIPTVFGVLTTNTIEEAIERAGTKAGNKGFDAAMTAVEMVNLIKNLQHSEFKNRSNDNRCCSVN